MLVRSFVHSSGSSLSRDLKLPHSDPGLSYVPLSSITGLSLSSLTLLGSTDGA